MIRYPAILLLVFSLFLAAILLREGVSLRTVDEVGQDFEAGDDQPWIRLAGVVGLVGLSSLIWAALRVLDRGEGWWWDAVAADLALFLAAAGTLLALLVTFALVRSAGLVGSVYRGFLGLDVVLSIGLARVGHRLRSAGSRRASKGRKGVVDDLAD